MKIPKSASEIRTIVECMLENDEVRSQNRALIDNLFNGEAPYTPEEAEESQIYTNVNFLDATRMGHDARGQFNNAFINQRRFLSVTIERAGVPQKDLDDWGTTITNEMNRTMKRSLRWLNHQRETFASSVLHGIGVAMWFDPFDWVPEFVGLGDFVVPEKSKNSIDEWEYFAIRQEYTPGKIKRLAQADPSHWDVEAVDMLADRAEEQGGPRNSYIVDNPEAVAAELKANSIDDTDEAEPVKVYDLFTRDDEGKWHRQIIAQTASSEDEDADLILYENNDWADEITEFLSIIFADGNSVPPFKFHATRGLGYMLYGVGELQNRLKSKMFDHIFEQLLSLFREQETGASERLLDVKLHNFGLVPSGLEFIPAAERFAVNPQLIGMGIGQNRQTMSENSSSFTQDIDLGTGKELTATEVQARLASSGQIARSVIALAKEYLFHKYLEVARRFSKKSSQKELSDFRKRCLSKGVPEDILDDYDSWAVDPELAVGNGQRSLEVLAANLLMQQIDRFEPTAQTRILHRWVQIITENPDFAEKIVPLDTAQTFPTAAEKAQVAVGALMDGAPVNIVEGIDHQTYVQTLFVSAAELLKRAAAMPKQSPDMLNGLANVFQHAEGHIQIIARNPNNKQVVKQLTDAFAQLRNAWEQLVSQLNAQEQSAQGEQSPEAREKAMMAQLEAQIKQARAELENKIIAARGELQLQLQQRMNDAKIEGVQRMSEAKAQAVTNKPEGNEDGSD